MTLKCYLMKINEGSVLTPTYNTHLFGINFERNFKQYRPIEGRGLSCKRLSNAPQR